MGAARSLVFVLATVPACGHLGGDPEPDAGPATLELATVVPDVARPMWRHAPITFQFASAVDLATLTEGVVIEVGGQRQAYELATETLEDGAVRVAATITWGPDEPASPVMGTIVLADTIRGDRGQPFAGATWSWTYPAWLPVAEPQGCPGGTSSPRLASGPDGIPVAACVEGERTVIGGKIVVYRQGSDATWQLDAADLIQLYPTDDLDLHVDDQGRRILAWTHARSNPMFGPPVHDLFVTRDDEMLETGTSPLGDIGPINRVHVRSHGDVTIVAWQYYLGVRIARWHDTTRTWTLIGVLTPVSGVGDFDVAIVDGVPVVAYVKHANPDGVHVATRGATISTWNELASPLFQLVGTAPRDPRLVVRGGVAHVVWREGGAQHDLYAARIATSDLTPIAGTETLDAEAMNDVSSAELAVAPSGAIYATWLEAGAIQARVARGGGGPWALIGPAVGAPSATTASIGIGLHGHPVIVHADPWNDVPTGTVLHNDAP